MYKNQDAGILGENIAVKYLINKGYYIYERNFKCKIGEIDIIAIDKIDKNELVFLEVKCRKQDIYGNPIDSIDEIKIKHIYHTAELFLLKNKLENAYIRFDIIEIIERPEGLIQLNHIKNAITDVPSKKINYT